MTVFHRPGFRGACRASRGPWRPDPGSNLWPARVSGRILATPTETLSGRLPRRFGRTGQVRHGGFSFDRLRVNPRPARSCIRDRHRQLPYFVCTSIFREDDGFRGAAVGRRAEDGRFRPLRRGLFGSRRLIASTRRTQEPGVTAASRFLEGSGSFGISGAPPSQAKCYKRKLCRLRFAFRARANANVSTVTSSSRADRFAADTTRGFFISHRIISLAPGPTSYQSCAARQHLRPSCDRPRTSLSTHRRQGSPTYIDGLRPLPIQLPPVPLPGVQIAEQGMRFCRIVGAQSITIARNHSLSSQSDLESSSPGFLGRL